MWDHLMPTYKAMVEKRVNDYVTNPKYTVLEHKTNNEIDALCVWHEQDGVRIVNELYSTSKNGGLLLKFIRKALDTVMPIACTVSSDNARMVNFYKRLGFDITYSDEYYSVMRRG